MTDFMDTALNYQAGIRIAPNSKWVMTNGTIQMDVCTVCAQPYREGHIDCTCPSNHPANCDRLTYDQLGEHLRRIAGDNMDFAMRYRNLLQTLLDTHNGGGDSLALTILSPTDVAEIDAALAWVGD